MQNNQKLEREARRGTLGGVREFFATLWGDKSMANSRLLSAIGGVAFGLCAYFLGGCELLFSTYPLGIALLCAANRYLPYILFGLLASSFGQGSGGALFAIFYVVTVVVRIFAHLLLDTVKGISPSEKYPKNMKNI